MFSKCALVNFNFRIDTAFGLFSHYPRVGGQDLKQTSMSVCLSLLYKSWKTAASIMTPLDHFYSEKPDVIAWEHSGSLQRDKVNTVGNRFGGVNRIHQGLKLINNHMSLWKWSLQTQSGLNEAITAANSSIATSPKPLIQGHFIKLLPTFRSHKWHEIINVVSRC